MRAIAQSPAAPLPKHSSLLEDLDMSLPPAKLVRPPVIARWEVTDAECEAMSWHDVPIHGILHTPETGELAFDIDYLLHGSSLPREPHPIGCGASQPPSSFTTCVGSSLTSSPPSIGS